MQRLTDKQQEAFNEVIDKALFGVEYSKLNCEDNPFAFRVEIEGECGEASALEKINAFFHGLGLLDKAKNLRVGDAETYCELSKYTIAGRERYVATFNHPKVLKFKPVSYEAQFVLGKQGANKSFNGKNKKGIVDLVNDLNAGKIRAKIAEGRFVMEEDRYDRVEAGKEDREWVLLSRGQLKRSVGIKTVRLYRFDGTLKPKKYMRWEVTSVNLDSADGDECDATRIPPGFWPETIVIHLGKRLPNG